MHIIHIRRSLILTDLTHVQQIRQEMPATTVHSYLNAGTFGPLPTCVIQAMQERLQYELLNGRLGTDAFQKLADIYTDARQHVATLLHADIQEIALTDNTSEGMNIIT